MAHYKFLRDLKDGKRGETIAWHGLLNSGLYKKSPESPTSEKHGDFQVLDVKNGMVPVNVEVKYDILAEKTGNMCFEFTNGKGTLTGILSTEADVVAYLLNNKSDYLLYMFCKNQLKSFLTDEVNTKFIRIVNGGDKKKFTMALAPVHKMHTLAFNVLEISRAKLPL